jgi:hypothetical protein
MIRTFNEDEMDKLQMNVFMKDGKDFIGCDLPQNPFNVQGLVSFWIDDVCHAVPIADTKRIELYVGE